MRGAWRALSKVVGGRTAAGHTRLCPTPAHVDYATQRRTLEDSALWYRDVIAADAR